VASGSLAAATYTGCEYLLMLIPGAQPPGFGLRRFAVRGAVAASKMASARTGRFQGEPVKGKLADIGATATVVGATVVVVVLGAAVMTGFFLGKPVATRLTCAVSQALTVITAATTPSAPMAPRTEFLVFIFPPVVFGSKGGHRRAGNGAPSMPFRLATFPGPIVTDSAELVITLRKE